MNDDIGFPVRDDISDHARVKERIIRERKHCVSCGSETGYDWPSGQCSPCWQAEALRDVPEEDTGYDYRTRGFHTREGADENSRLRRREGQ